TITWSIVSGFKGLENDVVILAALTDIETDWHRGVAYVGMSRARTRLHVIIHEDCDGKRREREVEWEAPGEGACENGVVTWRLPRPHSRRSRNAARLAVSARHAIRRLIACCPAQSRGDEIHAAVNPRRHGENNYVCRNTCADPPRNAKRSATISLNSNNHQSFTVGMQSALRTKREATEVAVMRFQSGGLKLLWWSTFGALILTSSGFVCQPSGDTRLSSLELEVLGANRIVFDSERRVYDVWLPEEATTATIRAVPIDPAARVTWYVPDGAGMLASGIIGVGGGEVTVALPPDGYSLYIGVYPPGRAVNTYIVPINPVCPPGDLCSNGGVPGTCSGNVCATPCVPSGPELCDGIDNDCNGAIDESIANIVAGTDEGECQQEIQQCINGAFVVVQIGVGPATEECDSLDNDCNGQSDDGIAAIVTGTNVGECRQTIESCVDGALTVVQAGIGPSAEACDGRDNDCNGAIDDSPACSPPTEPFVACISVDYSGSSLDGEDFRQASLECANFTDASLRGANFAGADLSFASFNGADLRDANLSGADLQHATFVGADLSFADLFGADLGNTNFTGADLTGAL
ncbi:MAG: pentapeptide repeat-containing protein, partial [Deltaproteobacteria bacterium]|nr:pentapeptide repeat-containing protein [Deltaproteobacteria bacterium]